MQSSWLSFVDVCVLEPGLTSKEVSGYVSRLAPYHPSTFFVPPQFLDEVKPTCREFRNRVCVGVSYPYGEQLKESKVDEVQRLLDRGVDELEFFSSLADVRSGKWDAVRKDIEKVSELTRPAGVQLKVFIETSTLSDRDVCKALEACIAAEADVFGPGACGKDIETAHDRIDMILKSAAKRIQVKTMEPFDLPEDAERWIEKGVARVRVGAKEAVELFDQAVLA